MESTQNTKTVHKIKVYIYDNNNTISSVNES